MSNYQERNRSYLSEIEAASFLNMSITDFRRAVANGKLPGPVQETVRGRLFDSQVLAALKPTQLDNDSDKP